MSEDMPDKKSDTVECEKNMPDGMSHRTSTYISDEMSDRLSVM
jgi:hypothetical protein